MIGKMTKTERAKLINVAGRPGRDHRRQLLLLRAEVLEEGLERFELELGVFRCQERQLLFGGFEEAHRFAARTHLGEQRDVDARHGRAAALGDLDGGERKFGQPRPARVESGFGHIDAGKIGIEIGL